MTMTQFRPGDTAYALADGLDITKGRGYRVIYAIPDENYFLIIDNAGDGHDGIASDFSHTPPAKETAMTTTPKAGDEMKVVVASAPDAFGRVNVRDSPYRVPLSALRPLPDPALTAAQLAVVEALGKHIDSFKGTYDAETWKEVLAAYEVLRALRAPPDPMKIAVEALEKLAALDTLSTWIGAPDAGFVNVRQTAQAALAAIRAIPIEGEPKS